MWMEILSYIREFVIRMLDLHHIMVIEILYLLKKGILYIFWDDPSEVLP